MTRIKYKNTGKGTLVAGPYLANSIPVYLIISLPTLHYFINQGPNLDDKTLKIGTGNTLNSTKKKGKAALKELGTQIYDEVRNRGKVEKLKY